jgi:fibronectin-binding autotransporter adhesin
MDLAYGNLTLLGGGIYNSGALTLNNATVSENNITVPYYGANVTVNLYGGGIYNHEDATLNIENSTISGNVLFPKPTDDNSVADVRGGGIYSEGTTLNIVNSTISDNTTDFSSGNRAFSYSLGGGIYIANGATISSSTIANNRCSNSSGPLFSLRGGGLYLGGTLTAKNLILPITIEAVE